MVIWVLDVRAKLLKCFNARDKLRKKQRSKKRSPLLKLARRSNSRVNP